MIRLKDPNLTLFVYGIGEVHNANITSELYQRLIELNPNFADLFEVVEDEEEAFG